MSPLPFSIERNARLYRNRRERVQAYAPVAAAHPTLLRRLLDWLFEDVSL